MTRAVMQAAWNNRQETLEDLEDQERATAAWLERLKGECQQLRKEIADLQRRQDSIRRWG